jgi:hypothetical protein
VLDEELVVDAPVDGDAPLAVLVDDELEPHPAITDTIATAPSSGRTERTFFRVIRLCLLSNYQ